MRRQNPLAFFAAAAAEGGATGITLNKQMMTCRVGAIHMLVAGLAALMASSKNMFANPLTHTIVKHKVLPQEPIRQILSTHLPHIIDDAPMQLMNL